ncbi:MAG: c-type cytochrome [Caulobacteraceae bacterium]
MTWTKRHPAFCMAMLALTLSSVAAAADVEPSKAQLEHGRSVYVAKGCYECHGLSARGARGVAPALAPPPLPQAAFEAYVRHPGGQMPPYSAKLVADPDLNSIYAYLKSLPAPRRAADIPLLAAYVVGATATSGNGAEATAAAQPSKGEDGAPIYEKYCSACHGADRGGGAGPALRNEGAKRTIEQIAAFIKDPPAPMPKLYPTPLSDQDVRAVATFVHAQNP